MKVSELTDSEQKKLKEVMAKDRLTRKDLFDLVDLNLRLAEGSRAPARTDVQKVCMELFDTLTRVVHEGKSVSVTGFGSFVRYQSPARLARNPQTGERMTAPSRQLPRFLPGALFVQYLNGRPLPKKGPVIGKAAKGSGSAVADYVKAGVLKRRFVKKGAS